MNDDLTAQYENFNNRTLWILYINATVGMKSVTDV